MAPLQCCELGIAPGCPLVARLQPLANSQPDMRRDGDAPAVAGKVCFKEPAKLISTAGLRRKAACKSPVGGHPRGRLPVGLGCDLQTSGILIFMALDIKVDCSSLP